MYWLIPSRTVNIAVIMLMTMWEACTKSKIVCCACNVGTEYTENTQTLILSWLDSDFVCWPAWGASERGRSVVLAKLGLILLETYSALTCHHRTIHRTLTATGGRFSSLPESGARLSLIEQHSCTVYVHWLHWLHCTYTTGALETRLEDLWDIWCLVTR